MASERYGANHSAASGSTVQHTNLNGNARRVALYEFNIGAVATPADTAVNWGLHRTTTAGTTPTATLDKPNLDSDGPTATAIPTGGTRGTAPTIAANNGICFRSESTSTGTTTYQISFFWAE